MGKIDICYIYTEFIRENKRHIEHMYEILTQNRYSFENTRLYAGRKMNDINEANIIISEMIRYSQPFMVARYGGTEMNAICQFIRNSKNKKIDNRDEAVERLCKTAGFFPKDIQMTEQFVRLMIESTKSLDLCGVWDLPMEDYVLRKYAPNSKITHLECLAPWKVCLSGKGNIYPWSSDLEGKKVLVIHPFDKTIKKQYLESREHLFERVENGRRILPDFDLVTLHAVQTINGNKEKDNYKDWFDALENMIDQCKCIDFDIAIIGCGAYGFPLAAEIKKMGKGAIHLGGATQILFGIIGKRWEQGEYGKEMSHIINDYWVRPSLEEQVSNGNEIEGGCYW